MGAGDGAAQHPQGAGEAQAIRVDAIPQRGVVHERADGEVGEEQTIPLLDGDREVMLGYT